MRKFENVTITAEGRDQGKRYLITEMPASQAEAWAIRALGAMSRSGVEIPEDALAGGMAVFAVIGLRALLAAPYEDVGPLMAEMFTCVQRLTDTIPRALVEDDIEEIPTRIRLRDEILTLHVGFSPAAALLEAVAQAQKTLPPQDDSTTTPTSPEASAS